MGFILPGKGEWSPAAAKLHADPIGQNHLLAPPIAGDAYRWLAFGGHRGREEGHREDHRQSVPVTRCPPPNLLPLAMGSASRSTAGDASMMNRRNILETCWAELRGAPDVRGLDRQHRGGKSGRRRRQTLCTVAVIAACTTASLPSGSAFVVPSMAQSWSQAYISARGLGVVAHEGGSRRAGRRRRTPVVAVNMVSFGLVLVLNAFVFRSSRGP